MTLANNIEAAYKLAGECYAALRVDADNNCEGISLFECRPRFTTL